MGCLYAPLSIAPVPTQAFNGGWNGIATNFAELPVGGYEFQSLNNSGLSYTVRHNTLDFRLNAAQTSVCPCARPYPPALPPRPPPSPQMVGTWG